MVFNGKLTLGVNSAGSDFPLGFLSIITRELQWSDRPTHISSKRELNRPLIVLSNLCCLGGQTHIKRFCLVWQDSVMLVISFKTKTAPQISPEPFDLESPNFTWTSLPTYLQPDRILRHYLLQVGSYSGSCRKCRLRRLRV